jgi:pimeloyl-ACP methyl ester carboxylesterase
MRASLCPDLLVLLSGVCLGVLAACEKPDTPQPSEAVDGAFAEGAAMRTSATCNEYRFDSALAVLQDSTALMQQADGLYAYAPPDTNTFGWMQARYVLHLKSTAVVKRPISILYFHGGGGDVGHAGFADDDLTALLQAGYDVWSVEYRRGWHAGSYDACLPRDPMAATPEDFLHFDTAAQWAYQDARAAAAFVAGLTGDSLMLWGSSFGAYLALALGPYAEAGWSNQQRLIGTVALFGSVPAGSIPQSRMPCFLLHGENDPIHGPDTGPLYGLGPMVLGSRSVYTDLESEMPCWLITHPGGHSTGGLTGKQLVRLMERSLLQRRIATGAYHRSSGGIHPVP